MVDRPDQGETDPKDQKYSFFFYGTLLVPAILVRVLGRDCSHLTFQDALLPDYTRHCVKNEDYPAIINRQQTAKIVPNDIVLVTEDFYTRGTVVHGLTYEDVKAIDVFEGTQYTRVQLPVHTLSPADDIHHLPKALLDPSSRQKMNKAEAIQAAKHLRNATDETKPDEDGQGIGAVKVWVYVWSDELSYLESSIWDFSKFLKDKAHVWTGLDTIEYQEVERHRALASLPAHKQGPANSPDQTGMDGEESKILGKEAKGYPDFGHNMKQYFKFDKNLVNLNHGSFGSPPVPVIEYMRKMSEECEAFPDKFMRRSYLPKLNTLRSQLADIIGARESEVVMVPNATHGVNNVVTQIDWQQGDVIIIYATTYGAVSQTMKYLCDRIDGIKLEIIDLVYPCTHASVVAQTEQIITKYNQVATPSYSGEARPTGKGPNERVRMIVMDSIISMPGVIFPFEEVVGLCKKYGIFSMVDGAHTIGQRKVNVGEIDCDFFVSNCHKWLLSHRGGALLYVPTRNQHLIRSTIPTSAGYESTKYPTEGIDRPWSWTRQYEWTGTQDWAPILGISAAIDWRKQIGGEERIMAYCHSLAVQGGRRLRKLWGTEIIENADLDDGELTAAMVNLVLPETREPKDVEDRFKQLKYFEDQLFEANTFAAVYWHAGRWIVRCSAQVFNELSDFDYVAGVLSKICEEIKHGKYENVEVKSGDLLHDPEDLPANDVA